MDFSEKDKDFLFKVACATVRRRLEGGNTPPMVISTPSVVRPAGCFVSLHKKQGNALRGCMGRIDASSPLLMVLGNVAWQVVNDARFASNPVTFAELPELTLELSILGLLKPTAKPTEFEPGTDGIYLSIAGRSGVFLPQVARETGWSREQLLDRLCQEKLGMPPQMWREPGARLFTFPTETIGPMDFSFVDLPVPKSHRSAEPTSPAAMVK